MALTGILSDLMWHATQGVNFGPLAVDTRMTIVRLPNRSLWVHSPVYPAEELVAAIRALGSVAYVVAPNRSHHIHFMHKFPEAEGFIAPGYRGNVGI